MFRYPDSVAAMSAPPPRRWWHFIFRHLPGLSVLILTGLLVGVVLWPFVVITVPSGHVGVLWKRFNGFDLYCWCFVGRGTILDPRELREEGLHIIWPWDRLFVYDLRLQSSAQVYNAISKDGVSVAAQINMRYQLLHNSIAVLHKFIGPQYLNTVVGPEIGSQAREVISQYTAEEVYTSREQIEQRIRENAQKSLGANLNKLVQPEAMEQPDPKHYNDFLQDSIQILDTLVLSIELPPEIVAAINRQTEEFYAIQEFKFRVEREAEESRRKQIEADGIAAFQRTVSQGISDSYLRWRGIEATLELARSPNAKIVIVGSGKDGLPIILGNVDSPAVTGGGAAGSGATLPSAHGTAPNTAFTPANPGSSTASTPGASANGNATPQAAPSGPTPSPGPGVSPSTGPGTAPGTAPGTVPGTAPNHDSSAQPRSSLELPDLKSAISRFAETLGLDGATTNAATAPQSRQ